MPTTFTLDNGTTTLNLVSAQNYVTRARDLKTPPPPHQITYAGSRRRDGTLPAFSYRQNREITIGCRIEGTSVDTLIDNYTKAALMIAQSTRYWKTGGGEGAKAVLTLQVNGATSGVQWDVLAGEVDPGNWAETLPIGGGTFRLLGSEVRLICSPFAEDTADVTATNNNQANSGISITISGVRGEVEAPAKFTFSPDQAFSASRLVLGKRTRGTPGFFQHLLRGESTADGASGFYSVAFIATTPNLNYNDALDTSAEAGVYGAASTPTTFDVTAQRSIRWTILKNFSDQYGQHRVLARMRSGMSQAFLTLFYGSQNTPALMSVNGASYAMNGTTWVMVDLGVITWPEITVPSNTSVAALVLELQFGGPTNASIFAAVNYLHIDYLLLVPVDEGYIDIPFTTTIASGRKVVLDGRGLPPSIYVADSSNALLGSITPGQIVGSIPTIAPGANRFIGYFDNTTKDVLADTVDVVETHRSRYHWLRGATL